MLNAIQIAWSDNQREIPVFEMLLMVKLHTQNFHASCKNPLPSRPLIAQAFGNQFSHHFRLGELTASGKLQYGW